MALHSQVLHTSTKELLQGIGMTCTGGLCLPDGSCSCSLCIPDHSCKEGLCLLDGLSGLGPILMQSSSGIRYQPSLVGVHGSPSCEQLPHGCIHFPLQLKYLLWQGAWVSPGMSPRLGNASPSQSSQCRRQRLGVTDWNSGKDVVGHDHTLWCLWRSGHWLRHGWVCSLQVKWVIYCGGGGAPKATDGSLFPGMLCWEAGIEVMRKVHCSYSIAPWIWRLRVSVILGWVSMAEKRGGTRVVLIA